MPVDWGNRPEPGTNQPQTVQKITGETDLWFLLLFLQLEKRLQVCSQRLQHLIVLPVFEVTEGVPAIGQMAQD